MEKYKLTNVSQIMKFNNSILLVDDEITIIEPFEQDLITILQNLLKGISLDDLNELRSKNSIDITEVLELLKENGLLKRYNENKYIGTTLEKQWYYFDGISDYDPNDCQKNIEDKMVCIIGLGGVGTVLVDSLMRSGVKKFVVLDFDNVTITNLNRQVMYDMNDLGKKKTDSIYSKIKKYDSSIKVYTMDKKIEHLDDLLVLDNFPITVIVNAADKPNNIADMVYKYAEKRCIAANGGSVGRNQGSWGPMIVPNKTTTYDVFKKNELSKMKDHEKYIISNECIFWAN